MAEHEPCIGATMICPRCKGRGKGVACIDGNGWGEIAVLSCTVCGSSGKVTPEHHARITSGDELRRARVGRGQSLREAARELEITMVELSRIERGEV